MCLANSWIKKHLFYLLIMRTLWLVFEITLFYLWMVWFLCFCNLEGGSHLARARDQKKYYNGCKNTEFTSKMRCFGKPTTEFSEFTSKTSVSVFMFSKTLHFTCELWELYGWFSKTLHFTCEFCESCVFTSVGILFLATRAREVGSPLEIAETQDS